ncbi:MAG: CvpA family protein [Planctomycetes bacterium]|nr:CvpA family protein [Planctomycetota bacterium]
MNWIDILCLLALLSGSFLGFFTGFFWQFTRFILILITLYLTFYIHEPIARWLGPQMSDPFMIKLLIYLFIFAGIYAIFFMITWLLELFFRKGKKDDRKPFLGIANRLGGSLFGLFKTALICGTILLGIVYYPMPKMQSYVGDSALAPYLLWYTRRVAFLMPKRYKQQLKHSVDRMSEQEKPSVDNKSNEPKPAAK